MVWKEILLLMVWKEIHMIRNSLICKLINVQASMKENNEKKILNVDEISKLIKALPKDIAG